MDKIVNVEFGKVLNVVNRVYVRFESGRNGYFDIRENAEGKRMIYTAKDAGFEITKEEIAEVKQLAKVDGKWTEYGEVVEQRRRNQEITDLVASGKYEYTYDNQGRITGCIEIKGKSANLFGSMYDGMG